MVKFNILANFTGNLWSALMSVAFVPVYISYLGMESYGLVGVFAALQGWLILLDLGMTQTLSREMARYMGGEHSQKSIRDLFFSLETIYLGIGVVILGGWLYMAEWVATNWLNLQSLPLATVVSSLQITGLVVALRWQAGLYRGAVLGLQSQVLLNGIVVLTATLRGVGTILALKWIAPTIEVFFAFQAVVALFECILIRLQLGWLLPGSVLSSRFNVAELQKILGFATGIFGITLLSLLLTQVDKLLLSRLLSLTDFGVYTLAGIVATALYQLVTPVSNAVSPKLVQLVASGNETELVRSYHRYARVLALTTIPAAVVISCFADTLLILWMNNPLSTRLSGSELAEKTTHALQAAPVLRVMILGTMCNGLMHLPYLLQLAYGWTTFAIQVNMVAVTFLVPATVVAVKSYGAIGAAIVWMVLNIGYVIISVPLMHRRLLPQEMRSYYVKDTLPILAWAAVVVVILRILAPEPLLATPLQNLVVLACAAAFTLIPPAIVSLRP